jgi:cyclophilin family peptidyl-prolyl cis-trans isomerase
MSLVWLLSDMAVIMRLYLRCCLDQPLDDNIPDPSDRYTCGIFTSYRQTNGAQFFIALIYAITSNCLDRHIAVFVSERR